MRADFRTNSARDCRSIRSQGNNRVSQPKNVHGKGSSKVKVAAESWQRHQSHRYAEVSEQKSLRRTECMLSGQQKDQSDHGRHSCSGRPAVFHKASMHGWTTQHLEAGRQERDTCNRCKVFMFGCVLLTHARQSKCTWKLTQRITID